ncbi:MAG: hypothetical protein LBI40_01180 [Treponema sp.]|jgi:hypothetical protein|nr:hypothetical protein [Treponema sp.]
MGRDKTAEIHRDKNARQKSRYICPICEPATHVGARAAKNIRNNSRNFHYQGIAVVSATADINRSPCPRAN